MTPRVGRFVVVGAVGLGVQLVVLDLLVRVGWPVGVSAATAVEAAVLHNFCWHQCWTWREEPATTDPAGWVNRLVRFHAANGAVSLACTSSLTWALAVAAGLPLVVANVVGVGVASVVNFVAADRWVFAPRR
jgi:putative flippase GtrA